MTRPNQHNICPVCHQHGRMIYDLYGYRVDCNCGGAFYSTAARIRSTKALAWRVFRNARLFSLRRLDGRERWLERERRVARRHGW